jgi:hypothetical protein
VATYSSSCCSASLGVAATILFRLAVGPNLSSPLQSGGLEGRILDKVLESDWLLLEVETEHGFLLATFTQMQKEIDLLVERGDTITLDVRDYRPTLEDPRIGKVRKPKTPIEPEELPARTGVKEEPRIPEPQGVELPAGPIESETAA